METEIRKAVVIGGSAGSMAILPLLLSSLTGSFKLPVIIICHLHPQTGNNFVDFLNNQTLLEVKEAADKQKIQAGSIYVPPADYHLLVEQDETFSLSVDAKVNHSRPSIDVLFESAAQTWTTGLTGIILTGANSDGSLGIQTIKKYGGLTIAQDPAEAAYPLMPHTAVKAGAIDMIMTIKEIGKYLKDIGHNSAEQIERRDIHRAR